MGYEFCIPCNAFLFPNFCPDMRRVSNHDAAGSWVGGKQQGGLWWSLEGLWRGDMSDLCGIKNQDFLKSIKGNCLAWRSTFLKYLWVQKVQLTNGLYAKGQGCLILQVYKTVHTRTQSPSILERGISLPYGTYSITAQLYQRASNMYNGYIGIKCNFVLRCQLLLFWGLGAVVASATWPWASRLTCTLSTVDFPKYFPSYFHWEWYKYASAAWPDKLVLCQLLNFFNIFQDLLVNIFSHSKNYSKIL